MPPFPGKDAIVAPNNDRARAHAVRPNSGCVLSGIGRVEVVVGARLPELCLREQRDVVGAEGRAPSVPSRLDLRRVVLALDVLRDSVRGAQVQVVAHPEHVRIRVQPVERDPMPATRGEVDALVLALPRVQAIRAARRVGVVVAHRLLEAGMVVVRRFDRRHERELLEVDRVVAERVDLRDRLGERDRRARRQADLVGVEVDEPVGVERLGERLFALEQRAPGVHAVPRSRLEAGQLEPRGDLDGRVRRLVVDHVGLDALTLEVLDA